MTRAAGPGWAGKAAEVCTSCSAPTIVSAFGSSPGCYWEKEEEEEEEEIRPGVRSRLSGPGPRCRRPSWAREISVPRPFSRAHAWKWVRLQTASPHLERAVDNRGGWRLGSGRQRCCCPDVTICYRSPVWTISWGRVERWHSFERGRRA